MDDYDYYAMNWLESRCSDFAIVEDKQYFPKEEDYAVFDLDSHDTDRR
jgi:hypothetical protein